MESKSLIWIGMFVGSLIGGYIPAIWGDGLFTMSSIFFSALGGFAGIWAGYKLSNW